LFIKITFIKPPIKQQEFMPAQPYKIKKYQFYDTYTIFFTVEQAATDKKHKLLHK